MNTQRIRAAAVAGLFYPAEAGALRGAVQRLLAGVETADGPRPRALIVPHAGYIYSGTTAAAGYARLRPWRHTIKQVLVLGPPHRVPVRGIAASSAEAFATPLGNVPLTPAEREPTAGIVALNDAAHALEHCIEVQLPFLSTVLDTVTVLPLLVAESSAARVAGIIATHWERDDCLTVISTDLSHFLDYDAARRRDFATDERIMALDDAGIGPEQACGCHALNGLLHLAARRGARIERLALCNSGDTAGSRERVVGYGSYTVY